MIKRLIILVTVLCGCNFYTLKSSAFSDWLVTLQRTIHKIKVQEQRLTRQKINSEHIKEAQALIEKIDQLNTSIVLKKNSANRVTPALQQQCDELHTVLDGRRYYLQEYLKQK